MNANANPLKVFYCYAKEAEEDAKLITQLTKHLAPLRRARKLTIWLDTMILPGADYKLVLEEQLKDADVILLLISPDFIASDYCYNLQLTAALNYHEAGKVDIIPILLRPVYWDDLQPLKRLPHMLPSNKKSVTLWPNCDEAFVNIAAGIRDFIQAKLIRSHSRLSDDEDVKKVLNQLGESIHEIQCPQCGMPNRIGAKFCKKDGVDLISSNMTVVPKPIPSLLTKDQWIEQGRDFYRQKKYPEALEAYEQALRLDPHYAGAYYGKGNVLYARQRYTEALEAYKQALQSDPNHVGAHFNKGNILLYALRRYHEALTAYEHVSRLNPKDADAHFNKGNALYVLRRYTEALEAYEQALLLNPKDADAHFNKGNALCKLERYAEALTAYKEALQINQSKMH